MTALPATPALLTLQGAALAYREAQQALAPLQEAYQAARDRKFDPRGVVIGGREEFEAYIEAGDALEAGKALCAQARARLHAAALCEDVVSPLQEVADAANARTFTLKFENDQWRCELLHDRVTFSGRGDLPEHALVEAVVDRQIGDHYYAANWDEPRLSQETMTTWLQGSYRHYLGTLPAHEYRGAYLTGRVK